MSEPKANSRKNSTFIILGVGLAFMAVIVFQQMTTFPTAFEEKAKKSREAKDLQFRNDPDSPIPQEVRDIFAGLRYFAPDEDLRVEANLVTDENQDTLKLLTTTGAYRQVLNYGKFYFRLDDQDYSLQAFKYTEPGVTTLFVPFTDETTGKITYGGGRYLDVPIADEWFLDFNEAYNPYCVYNDSYSCPIPTRENHIPREIRAGELDYKPKK
ncbi:MAG: DUF1684 domain-containing protein [Bacteroidota bacterium]